MKQKKLRFAVFGNTYQSKKSQSVEQVLRELARHGSEISIDRPFYEFLSRNMDIDLSMVQPFDGCAFDADFVISVGGDGTFLKTAACVGARQTPILGVKTGRLGFLADVLPKDAAKAIDALFDKQYEIEAHTVIQAHTDKNVAFASRYALNEIAILKRDNASMITIRASVNGEHLATYQADGLIIATPTGSTAYSLSNGGPIMMPHTGTFCLTPVASHSLNIRPIVISDNATVELKVKSRSHNVLLAFDGRSETVSDGATITITKAAHKVNIVKQSGHTYISALHEKMMWAADSRKA